MADFEMVNVKDNISIVKLPVYDNKNVEKCFAFVAEFNNLDWPGPRGEISPDPPVKATAVVRGCVREVRPFPAVTSVGR